MRRGADAPGVVGPVRPMSWAPGDRPDGTPVVAVLAPRWEARSEEGWLVRQVAGALACAAEVHVITPDGRKPETTRDGVFTLHRLGTPLDRAAERRRDLLVSALGQSAPAPAAGTPGVSALLDRDLTDGWAAATGVLDRIRPDRVVIAGHTSLGALAAVEAAAGEVPVGLLVLGSDLTSAAFPHFAPLFARADVILVATETEGAAVAAAHGCADRVRRIGAPLSTNLSALSEPNPWVGPSGYVLVLTTADVEDDDPQVELSRLVRLRFPERPVGLCYTDGFFVWHEGRLNRGWPVERSSDMARLLAWARVVVDLDPGTLIARRCVESLLYGTPIVVGAGTRAREHAQRGGGGLWFDDPAELLWGVEALLDDDAHAAFSAQGQAYAEDEYGSTDRFVERVTSACRIAAAS
jgi:hypothetical protein